MRANIDINGGLSKSFFVFRYAGFHQSRISKRSAFGMCWSDATMHCSRTLVILGHEQSLSKNHLKTIIDIRSRSVLYDCGVASAPYGLRQLPDVLFYRRLSRGLRSVTVPQLLGYRRGRDFAIRFACSFFPTDRPLAGFRRGHPERASVRYPENRLITSFERFYLLVKSGTRLRIRLQGLAHEARDRRPIYGS